MIFHHVFFKFKDGYSWESPKSVVAESITKEHDKHIEEIKGWFCGRNTTSREDASDFLVVGLFDDQKSIDLYIHHIHHQLGAEKWKEIASWNVIDINIKSSSSYTSGLLTDFTKDTK